MDFPVLPMNDHPPGRARPLARETNHKETAMGIVIETEHTVIDTAAPQAAPVPVGPLATGPALAAFDVGVYEVSAPVRAPQFARTLIGMPAPLHLPAPIDDDTVVQDDPDA